MAIAAGGATNTAIDARMKWAPTTAYTLGQQVISPNNDVVKANVAHTSAAAYATDVAKWDLSLTLTGKVAIADRPLSLHGYAGIDFTGTADSSAAVQAFINAAPDGSQIDFGKGGVLRLDSGLDLSAKANITLTGPTRSIAVGSLTQTELSFINMTTGIGLNLGVSATVRNLLVRGPGYGVAGVTGISSSSGIATLEGVQLLTWATALALHTTWYGIIRDCEFRYNALAILVDHCYNLTIDIPKINGANGAGFGVGISLTNTSMVNINNGSIEMCSPGVNMTTACSLNMDGTYWETSAANGVGVNMNGVSNAFVSARNCQVFINNYLGWIDYQNTSGGSTLNAEGNFFTTAGTGGTPTIPIAYMLDAVPGSEVSLGVGGPDNWRLVAVSFPTALYTNRDGLLAARLNMRAPAQYGGGIDGTSAKQGRHVRMALGMVVQLTATSTAGRTAAATAGNGGMAYDATLHKPIWSDGATWRDATGTAV
jgi:hypothetical protein